MTGLKLKEREGREIVTSVLSLHIKCILPIRFKKPCSSSSPQTTGHQIKGLKEISQAKSKMSFSEIGFFET